jgi:hypothetical protein
MDYDAMKDARSDARYWSAADEWAPAQIDEPEWTLPEPHQAGGWPWSVEEFCGRCMRGLIPEVGCFFCDVGCPNGCGPLDRDAFCTACGRTTWPNQHPGLRDALKEAA